MIVQNPFVEFAKNFNLLYIRRLANLVDFKFLDVCQKYMEFCFQNLKIKKVEKTKMDVDKQFLIWKMKKVKF